MLGNYWVLAVFDKNSRLLTPNKNEAMIAVNANNSAKNNQSGVIYEQSKTLNCDSFCYRTAFFQIIASYSIIILFVIYVIPYKIYLITCKQKKSQFVGKKKKDLKLYKNQI